MGGGYYYDHLWSLKGFYIMFKTDSAAETIYNSFCVDESAFKVALKYNAVIASWFSSPVPT